MIEHHDTDEPQLTPREQLFVRLAPWLTFAIIILAVNAWSLIGG